MTTIAYKDGIIAYDSRAVSGTVIVDDNRDKKTVAGKVVCFCSGAQADIEKFLAAYNSQETPKSCDIQALVVDQGILYCASYDDAAEDGFWREEIRLDMSYALGSGARYAFTAMDMGATAREAVKMAAKRDASTGGRIRTYKLK